MKAVVVSNHHRSSLSFLYLNLGASLEIEDALWSRRLDNDSLDNRTLTPHV